MTNDSVECMCGICKLGKRQWVGLTDDDRAALREMATFMDETDCSHLLSLAEERLKEKNE